MHWLFQSLKGHQPKWNDEFFFFTAGFGVSIPKRASAKVKLSAVLHLKSGKSVSIPKRASAKVKLGLFLRLSPFGGTRFQSLKGHQPKWNGTENSWCRGRVGFQSLKGHQPKWNSAVEELGPDALFSFQSLKGHQPKWNVFGWEWLRRRNCFNP